MSKYLHVKCIVIECKNTILFLVVIVIILFLLLHSDDDGGKIIFIVCSLKYKKTNHGFFR